MNNTKEGTHETKTNVTKTSEIMLQDTLYPDESNLKLERYKLRLKVSEPQKSDWYSDTLGGRTGFKKWLTYNRGKSRRF